MPLSAVLLLDFIGRTEAPGGYEVIYRNRQNTLARPLTQMTLAEVLAAQPGWEAAHGSSAAGRYQVISATLSGVIEQLGLDAERRFDPGLQDLIGYTLLQRRGFDRFIAHELRLEDFALQLAMEWAAFPVLAPMRGAHRRLAAGETYYAGDRRNRALIAPERLVGILRTCLSLAEARV